MIQFMQNLTQKSRSFFGAMAVMLTLVVGAGDYITGVEIFFSVFYLIPVAVAVWFVGTWFGVLISVLSVVAWLAGDLAAGAHYTHPFVPVWNLTITLAFYLAVVWLLARLRLLQKGLEDRVRQRTDALIQEIAERERLEDEILNVAEREQQRIGRDLHDGLGQQLTAAAFAGKVLVDQLVDQPGPATAARRVVSLIEDGITLTRVLAHGLTPVKMVADGLMEAFEELADTISDRFQIECRFECDVPVLVSEARVATHLYWIAQEAINNAVKHGLAKHIVVQLSRTEAGTVLEICDDGTGLPEPLPVGQGMGLRIMAHRATMISGKFTVQRGQSRGTSIVCVVP